MKSAEQLAEFCEAQLANKLSFFNDSRVIRITPSVVIGRRYIGFDQDGKNFLIEINVSEV